MLLYDEIKKRLKEEIISNLQEIKSKANADTYLLIKLDNFFKDNSDLNCEFNIDFLRKIHTYEDNNLLKELIQEEDIEQILIKILEKVKYKNKTGQVKNIFNNIKYEEEQKVESFFTEEIEKDLYQKQEIVKTSSDSEKEQEKKKTFQLLLANGDINEIERFIEKYPEFATSEIKQQIKEIKKKQSLSSPQLQGGMPNAPTVQEEEERKRIYLGPNPQNN